MKKKILYSFISLATLLLCMPDNLHARKFRVMTFNIRLITTADGDNIWTNRSLQVCDFIASKKPDVFGVQEATKTQMDDLTQHLDKYAFVGVGRDDGKEKGEYSPVFYNKEKYRLIKSGTFWLSETPEVPSMGWDAACRRVCSWAVLQNIKTGNSFVYANTHLDHMGVQARSNGAMLIKVKLSQIANDLPMMITGDFNVTKEDAAYSTMCNRFFLLDDAYLSAPKRVGLKSSWNNWGRVKDEEGSIIDFIFITPNLKVKKAYIHDGNLGNGHYLSDHNAVYVDLDGKIL